MQKGDERILGDADTLDGMDSSAFGDIMGVNAGTGLSGGGPSGTVTVSASFAGSGSATTITRSDHNHDGRYYTKAYVDALESRIKALETLLAGVSRNGNDITFSGVDVHVGNGTGSLITVQFRYPAELSLNLRKILICPLNATLVTT